METITEILKKYDTDKEDFHHYGKPYQEIFSKFNRTGNLNILEVGTQKGGSLLAWKEYFPNANVVGVDVVDVVPEKYRLDSVTRIISDIKDWKDDTKWDIVIDDGSHYLGDMVYVVANYIDKLNINGVLIMEDVRFPDILLPVIENLIIDMKSVKPHLDSSISITISTYDNRTEKTECSYMIALFKKKT